MPPPLARRLRLITLHEALASALVWIPVFVLFTRARFDLSGALALASIYYLAVVALEVPSGWMSDRLGRAPTLRVAAASWVVAHSCFLLGDDRFWMIALGQVFLAGGFASLSGTDVTYHYDTLEAFGREAEYRGRQARLRAIGLTVTALSSLVGGVVGLVEIRVVFAVALALAVAQFVVTLRLEEPTTGSRRAEGLREQLATSLGYLTDRYLGWIFFYGVVLVTLEHVAYTLMQPWLTEVLGQAADDVGSTPVFAGAVFAVTSVIGAVAARTSARLGERFGTIASLIGLAALSATIVTGMALWSHAAVILLVVFRSAQGAAAPVLISAAVAPRVQRHHRATFLSVNSLAGRLGYGLLLLALSDGAADNVNLVLVWLAALSWALVAVLAASVLSVPKRRRAG